MYLKGSGDDARVSMENAARTASPLSFFAGILTLTANVCGQSDENSQTEAFSYGIRPEGNAISKCIFMSNMYKNMLKKLGNDHKTCKELQRACKNLQTTVFLLTLKKRRGIYESS